MTTTLLILIGVVVAVQWLHLAVRQRRNTRTSPHRLEPQVIGLAASFAAGLVCWGFAVQQALSGRLAPDESYLIPVALAVASVGAALRIVAIERIGRNFSWGSEAPSSLITDGIYRYVRHPLILGYAFEVQGLAMAGVLAMPAIIPLAVMVMVAWCAMVQRSKEELVLAERFGEEWYRYRASTLV